MKADFSLAQLEADVFARMAAHRRMQSGRRSLSIGVLMVACALVAGLGAGLFHARGARAPGSESVVLADDASLAPSTLLANAQ
jgi:ABC-type dipeptide/oligopeptide/nickel transport system permease subunit